MNTKWEQIAGDAEKWMKEATENIKHSFQEVLEITSKSHKNDLVTNIDKEVEAFFYEKITDSYPGHVILGEESAHKEKIDLTNGTVWIIDPIDGTLNFIHQQREFAVSIGVYENGVGKVGLIYDVMRDEMYVAITGQGAYLNGERLHRLEEGQLSESLIGLNAFWLLNSKSIPSSGLKRIVQQSRGIRSYGSAALEITSVVSGRIDGYISLNLASWDIAGGMVLLNEVGAIFSDGGGKAIDLNGKTTFVTAKPGLYDELMSVLHQ
ncbi:MAG: inositol monophosphatase family protein [Bacillus sp. (in: firmicutes)]